MSSKSGPTHSGSHTGGRLSDADEQLPPWAAPLVRTCEIIYPYFLGIAALIIALAHALLFVGKTEFPWLPQLISYLGFFLSVGYIAAVCACYHSVAPGWIGLVLGIALRFSPVLTWFLAQQGKVVKDDKFLQLVQDNLPSLGLVLIVVAIIDLAVVYTVKFITYRRETHGTRFKYIDISNADATKRDLIPKCWQMSRCRPGVRMTCPNYLDRTTCWKRRSGCFCDRELANYLMQASARNESDEVTDMQRVASKAGAITGHLRGTKRRPWKLQKTLCHNCPLFVEHQEYKYKNLQWISFPITGLIVYAFYGLFHEAYALGAGKLDAFMEYLMKVGKLPENFNPDASHLAGSGFEYILLGVLALLLSSYVIAVTEKIFVDWKM